MTQNPLVMSPQAPPRTLDIVGEHVRVLASGEATGGYAIFRQQRPAGSGPPRYRDGALVSLCGGRSPHVLDDLTPGRVADVRRHGAGDRASES